MTSENMKLTFSVLEHSLNQHRVLCYPLGYKQDAFWDTKPPHNAATHLFLEGQTRGALVKHTHTTGGMVSRIQ